MVIALLELPLDGGDVPRFLVLGDVDVVVRGDAGVLLLGAAYADEHLVGLLRAALLRQRCPDLLQLGLEAAGELVVHAVLLGGLGLGAHPVEGVGGGGGQLPVFARLEVHLHALYLYRLVQLVLDMLHGDTLDGLVCLAAGARHAQELVFALPEQGEVLLRGDAGVHHHNGRHAERLHVRVQLVDDPDEAVVVLHPALEELVVLGEAVAVHHQGQHQQLAVVALLLALGAVVPPLAVVVVALRIYVGQITPN